MKSFTATVFAAATFLTTALGDAVPWERLNKNDSMLLILDLQVGLYGLARDFDPNVYHNAMMAHSALGQLFDIPVVMTTSAQEGPNGVLPKAILDMYPDAPLIQRHGEVDAWDNEEFREAVKSTGKKQIIVGGLVTDVCTAFLALSLRAEGYSVWANVEASGTTTELIRNTANDQMARAGVNIVSLFAIVCDLMRDWRHTPGAQTVLPWLAKYYPAYGMIAEAHNGAIKGQGESVMPGEAVLKTQV
ncbi:uncharacterized protein LTR77_005000 [Saxophila tyrrhenica]|uniref:Isochorismatase-like domain-containing protein n=1 Tax=Saxophila tyrrhenica TaxID=1690608 RepID=A0AAV9PAS3_9PEZI|nr:hypothetical protein LTR77_005000 [Saxophila tyrrhenica]